MYRCIDDSVSPGVRQLVLPPLGWRGRTTYVLALCSLLFLLNPSRAVADFSGAVVSVLDGDTIEVLHYAQPERVRLSGIDCPEKGQAYSNNAKQAASTLVFGKQITLRTYGLDKYGRTIADVFLPDGTNVNHTLVKAGWCWWYRKYAPRDTELERLEQDAREAKKGLWADPAPIPPWVYRKARRGQAPDWLDMEAPEAEVVPRP
jgi:micrococcal nuclease